MNQRKRVIEALMKYGKVSRNYFLDLPTNKITRLGAIIHKLRNEGYDIDTTETHNDTIYSLRPKRVETWNMLMPDGTKQPYQKSIWK